MGADSVDGGQRESCLAEVGGRVVFLSLVSGGGRASVVVIPVTIDGRQRQSGLVKVDEPVVVGILIALKTTTNARSSIVEVQVPVTNRLRTGSVEVLEFIILFLLLLVLISTSAIRATASFKFLIKLEHAAGLLAGRHNRTTAARPRPLLVVLGRKLSLGRLQLGEVRLGGQLVWVARQHHPIEEGDAVGGRDGKRRRAVRREGVQRALGDALGDAVDCAGQGAGLGSGVSFVFAQLVALGRGVACLPDVAVDDQVLLLEALGQLELVIVHQRRIGDDNQWGADAQYLTDRSGA